MSDISIEHGRGVPNLGRDAAPRVQPAAPPSIKHQIDTAHLAPFAVDHSAAIASAEAYRLKLIELRKEAERATAALREMHKAIGAVDATADHEPVVAAVAAPEREDENDPKMAEVYQNKSE